MVEEHNAAGSHSLEFVSILVGVRVKSDCAGVTPWFKKAFRMKFGVEW